MLSFFVFLDLYCVWFPFYRLFRFSLISLRTLFVFLFRFTSVLFTCALLMIFVFRWLSLSFVTLAFLSIICVWFPSFLSFMLSSIFACLHITFSLHFNPSFVIFLTPSLLYTSLVPFCFAYTHTHVFVLFCPFSSCTYVHFPHFFFLSSSTYKRLFTLFCPLLASLTLASSLHLSALSVLL